MSSVNNLALVETAGGSNRSGCLHTLQDHMGPVGAPAAAVSVALQDIHFLMISHFAVGSRYYCARKRQDLVEAYSLQLEQRLSTEFSGRKEAVVMWERSVLE